MFLEILTHKNIGKKLISIVLLLSLSSVLGCSKSNEEQNNGQSYLVKVNDHLVYENEVMIYVNKVTREFEEIGGKNVWEFEDFSGGKSAIEVAKEAVIDNIVRIKVLKDKSNELNLTLNKDEISVVNEEAIEYLSSISDAFKEVNNVELEIMIKVFSEFAIANKVMSQVTDEFNPASDEIIARMNENEEYSNLKGTNITELLTEIYVEHILFTIREKDQSGEYVTLTEDEKSIKYNKVEMVLQLAIDGVEFDTLMNQYSEEIFPEELEDNGIYQFSKALLPEEFKEELMFLDKNEISNIVESELGYHIFRVKDIVVPTDEEIKIFNDKFILFEEDLRKTIIQQLKEEAFNRLYNEWKKSVDISIDREVWEIIDLKI